MQPRSTDSGRPGLAVDSMPPADTADPRRSHRLPHPHRRARSGELGLATLYGLCRSLDGKRSGKDQDDELDRAIFD